MNYIEKLRASVEGLEEKNFFMYLLIALGGLVILVLLLMFYYYQACSSAKRKIATVNKLRSQQVKAILAKDASIKTQKEKLDTMLTEDPSFKLAQYVTSVLAQTGMSERFDLGQQRNVELDDRYDENILEITLNDIDMKQLTEFISAVDTNKRVYVKKLEIAKSKTAANKLSVNVVFATLFPRAS